MRLRPEQLAGRLQDAGSVSLAPVYLLSGDEPFQLEQASGAIRARAATEGYGEREVLHVDRGFDWQRLGAAADSLSLFASRRLVELRLPTGKPGDTGGKALKAWCENPPADTLLLIVAGKLEKAQQNTRWFKAIDAAGVVVQVWPLGPDRLPGWIRERMQLRDMQPTPEALAMLVDRVEGNLLAADQELEKLRLLTGGGAISAEQVAAAVSDSARFDVFSLVDTALAGEAERAVRILRGLQGEGVEPVLILWALGRELRALCGMSRELQAGKALGQVLGQYRVWDKRKGPVQAALRRYPLRRWQGLLWQADEIEKIIKGQAPGRVADELVQLTLKIAGRPLFRVSGR
ncbi:MAG: DNA polymerase III subunit delta [Alphaproteobacteria bacterium]